MKTTEDDAAPDAGRRSFLRGSGALVGASWLAANILLLAKAAEAAHTARTSGAAFVNLSPEEAADFAAVALIFSMVERAAMNEVYVQFFLNNRPAGSAVAGRGLALGARVEIECIAVVGEM